jgi:two-component system, LytTR family, response regulator LytT
MKILIAEDEAIIAVSIFKVLTDLEYEPIEPAINMDEALSSIESYNPTFGIIDIHLGEYYSGFKVAEVLQKKKIPFIFLTALYDKETIEKAKIYNPAAYLVKPFTKQNLFATIEMSLLQASKVEESNLPQIVFIKEGSKTIPLNLAEIVYLESNNKYIFVHFSNKKKQILRSSFKEIMFQLNCPTLIQIHKSYVINKVFITSMKYDEILLGEIAIPVGRVYREDLKKKLK